MEGVAFNVEGGNASGCCYTYSIVKEKSQAMDQVWLSGSSCSSHYEPKWQRVASLSVLLYQSVGLQLLALQLLRISRGYEGVLWS